MYYPDPNTTKRGSEQLESNYDNWSQNERSNSTKKPKVNDQSPKKVLHVRNLPFDVSEEELISLASGFGPVRHVLLLSQKAQRGQAFVEMEDKEHAIALVQYYSNSPPLLRGRTIYFQYSSREALTFGNNSNPSAPDSTKQTQPHFNTQSYAPNTVLLVTVQNLLYPVTIESLYQIFSPYGPVTKIIISQLNSPSKFCTPTCQDADEASKALNGRNVYTNCCTLTISPASLPDLYVQYNNDKSRDFTNSSLPSGPPDLMNNPLLNLANSLSTGWIDPLTIPTLLAQVASLNASYNTAPTMPNPSAYTPPATDYAYPAPTGSSNDATVLIVSNLEPSQVTPDVLFVLFGVYGDVMRVKILFNKPDTALIQFATTKQCQTAYDNLNGCVLFGKAMLVNYSKHQSVSLPRPGEENAAKLTKDYSGSSLHRFRVENSKNYRHICPPTAMLHVSNIVAPTTEEELRSLFGQYGNVVNLQFFAYVRWMFLSLTHFSNDFRMCLVEMSTVQEAIEALVFMHNYRMGDSNIRVTFSSSKIK